MDTPDAKTFSVIEAVAGTAYPSDDVTVYTNQQAAHQIARLESQINETEDDEAVNALDAQIAELREKVLASKLTFHMRGISPGVRAHVDMTVKQKKFGEDHAERNRFNNSALLAAHIVKVTNADGATDEHIWEPDEIVELVKTLPEESTSRLLDKMNELTFEALYFDTAVSADFLSKS